MNTVKTFDASLALAAITLAASIKYRWERLVLWTLANRGGLESTQSFVWLDWSTPLKGWQVARLREYGLIERRIRRDDSIPQSMSDAPMTENRYVPTEKALALAAYLGLDKEENRP